MEAVIGKIAQEQYGPLAGIGATALGLLAALIVFPEDPSPQGALMLSGTVLAIGILFVPAMRMITTANTMMNADNFVAVGYVGWLLLDLIQGVYDLSDASDDALWYALVAVGVSAMAMWVGALSAPWKLPKWLVNVASHPLDTKAVMRLVPVCFMLGMANFLYSVRFDVVRMFTYLGNSRWDVPWGRGQLGGWGSFIDQTPYFGYVLPSLTALLIVRQGFKFTTLTSIAASLVMLAFLAQGGGRRIILVTVGAALIVWIQAQPGMKVRKFVIVGALSIALVWTMQLMLSMRDQGYDEFVAEGRANAYLHVDDNFLRVAQIIQLVPARHDYVYWQQIIFTLVRPVPRVFWPGKPITPGFDLPTELGMKEVSLSSSIIGEWYLSFGFVAVIFGGWFHGRLASTANSLRVLSTAAKNPIVYAMAVMVLVAGLRSMQDLVIMSYALVAWWGVNRLVTPKARKAS